MKKEKATPKTQPYKQCKYSGFKHEDIPGDFEEYQGFGPVHKLYRLSFREAFMKCSLSGNWYRVDSMMFIKDHGSGVYTAMNKIAAQTQGIAVLDHFLGEYILKSEAIEFIYSAKEGLTAYCNKNLIDQHVIKASNGKLYARQCCFPMLDTETSTAILVAPDDLDLTGRFQCAACNVVFPTSVGQRKLAENTLCPTCFVTNICAGHSFIQPWNGKEYPKVINVTKSRMGAEKRLGQWFATGAKEEFNDPLLFGVELEIEFSLDAMVEKGLNRADMIVAIKDALGRETNSMPQFVMMKEDGTLTANGKYNGAPKDNLGRQIPTYGKIYAGFEIISAPAPIDIHRQYWGKLEQIKHFNVIRAWDTETCGMHVHVSRAPLTRLQIGKALVFINHLNNKIFIQRVAGRSEKRYTRYIPKNTGDVLHPERVRSPDEEDSHNASRRVALNLSNSHTIEFRIFRGTVNVRHIIRNIEFCYALLKYCAPCEASVQDMGDYKKFISFVVSRKKEWPLLHEWITHPSRDFVSKVVAKRRKSKMGDVVTTKPSEIPENEEKGVEGFVHDAPALTIKPPQWITKGIKFQGLHLSVPAPAHPDSELETAMADLGDDDSSDE